MAKIVIKKFNRAKKDAHDGTVVQKRVRDASSGQYLTVRKIDAHSKTLGQDLAYVFGKNVAKARRDNKAVTGVVDRAPAKP